MALRFPLLALLFAHGVSGCGEPNQMRSANFATLNQCLEGIKRNSGMSLEIVTDKPDNVSGSLSNGQGFGCILETSGTKGTYFNGWYMIESK